MDEKGLDAYLKSSQKTAEQLRDELRPLAARSLRQSLVMTELAKSENVKIEKADLQAEIESMVKDIPEDRKQNLLNILTIPQNQVNIASSIATRKTVEKLKEIVQSPAVLPDNNEKSENAAAAPAEAIDKEVQQ